MDFKNIVFLDIETIPSEDPAVIELFKKRFPEDDPDRAGMFGEHCQIVSIAVAIMHKDGKFHFCTYYGSKEKMILSQFAAFLEKLPSYGLCAHNGKGFDFPVLFRRFVINGMRVPNVLNTIGISPWNQKLYDTMDMWAGAQWKYKVSLNTLMGVFGYPSPKTDIDGSMVAGVYREGGLKRIATYNTMDVVALVRAFGRINGLPEIPAENFVLPEWIEIPE